MDKKKPDKESGVTITEVLPGGAAATAGMRVGDRLLSLDGRWTDSVADCYTAAGYVKPGTEVRLVVVQGKEIELRVRPLPGAVTTSLGVRRCRTATSKPANLL